MTISEAIKHCKEVVEENESKADRIEQLHLSGNAEGCRECASDHQQLAEWLKELKQLREQTRWIPCDERLPECNVLVLATCKLPQSNRYRYLEILRRTNDGSWTGNLDYYSPDSVVAWRPLPTLYKAESEVTGNANSNN